MTLGQINEASVVLVILAGGLLRWKRDADTDRRQDLYTLSLLLFLPVPSYWIVRGRSAFRRL
jgi:hypothetical protein